ncbi:MAG: tRNA threonylcarbamoyladenosine biosynthesis protein TsaB [Aquificaceae bacterium]
MKVLSFDTSFSFLNLSIIENGKPTLLFFLDGEKKTLENLPKVFQDMDIYPQEYDAYAISLGVGYLTPLRIGITFMKTWAYLFKKPIVGYENLELMLKYAQTHFPCMACLKVSNKIFARTLDEKGISDIKIVSFQELDLERTISLKGQGIESKTVLEFFPFSLYGGLESYKKLSSGYRGDDPFFLEPIYLTPVY